jgi:hypothetical protein
MNERLIHLKIKIKNLADEARTIRHEERKLKRRNREVAERKKLPTSERERMGYAVYRLQEHRKTIVRRTARHNLLAYAFLRGRSYNVVEPAGCKEVPDWDLIKGIAKRFSLPAYSLDRPELERKLEEEFKAWAEAGQEWLEGRECAA